MENRILLLEDDVSLIDGLQYSLKKNGFDVDFVRSVQETLTYLSEIEKYDMLILDVTLPDGTGFEICEKVRKNGSQIQLSQNATENDVNEIHRLVGSQYTFSDERMGNSNTRGAYYCFGLFIYGFLVLIALITLFNIINSIAMSVVAKMKQYGVFRAIGLSNRQLAKMIIAEASTYAITGTICGSVLGIVCNKILFSKLITYKWGDAWSVPLVQLGIIIVVVAIAVILAVRNPIKKLEKTSIVDIISVQ